MGKQRNNDTRTQGTDTSSLSGKQGSSSVGQSWPALWLTITNVRLKAGKRLSDHFAHVEVQVQGDAGEGADCGPRWLDCEECIPEANHDKKPPISADKLYDKILEALQNNRKVRGNLGFRGKEVIITEVQVQYQ